MRTFDSAMNLPQGLWLPVAFAGLSSHLLFWIQGERSNMEIRIWLYFHCLINLLLSIILYSSSGIPVTACLGVFYLNLCFYGPLFASIFIYRAFFHRLHRFPGPFSLKLSKLVALHADSKKSQNHLRTWDLHKKYGSIVRIGPQELSVLDSSVVGAIYGPSSQCTRAPWYGRFVKTTQGASEKLSVFSIRDPAAHSERRRAVWDKTFSVTGRYFSLSFFVRMLRNFVQR
jgi:hypothetical protein